MCRCSKAAAHTNRRFRRAASRGGLKQHSGKRNQPSVGGRQTPEGEPEGRMNPATGTKQDDTGGCVAAWDDATADAQDGLHACPVLHALPVLAAPPASLQQSSAAADCSIVMSCWPCFIGQACLNVYAFAMPWKAIEKNSKRTSSARIAGFYQRGQSFRYRGSPCIHLEFCDGRPVFHTVSPSSLRRSVTPNSFLNCVGCSPPSNLSFRCRSARHSLAAAIISSYISIT